LIPFDEHSPAPRDPHRSIGGSGREARLARGGADDALLRDLELRKLQADGDDKRRWEKLASWLIGPLLLAATLAAVLFVLRGPDHLFGAAFGGVLALGLAWILISSLFPGRADRRCPRCGAQALERLDPKSTRGLRCGACGMVDAHTSSFLLAEDEGAALEDVALRDRSPRRF
jgi:hypothetical protein